MEDILLLYSCLLDANNGAFEKQLFKLAYHMLSGAIYCALQLEDGQKVNEVEKRAREQFQMVKVNSPRSYPSSEPTELGLYASLVEIAAVRGAVLRNHALRAN